MIGQRDSSLHSRPVKMVIKKFQEENILSVSKPCSRINIWRTRQRRFLSVGESKIHDAVGSFSYTISAFCSRKKRRKSEDRTFYFVVFENDCVLCDRIKQAGS